MAAPTLSDRTLEDQTPTASDASERYEEAYGSSGQLSAVSESEAEQAERTASPFVAGEERKTVLVVDDERSIARLLMELLTGAGYRVLVASGGHAALGLARSERPALILTDYMMPGMDGKELVRRLRGSPVTNDIPIVMMSSERPRLASRESIAGIRSPEAHILDMVGCDVYLAHVGDILLPFLEKPFDLDVVLDIVRTATEAEEEERQVIGG